MTIDVFPLPRGPLAPGVGRVGGWVITSYFGNRIDPLRGVPSRHGGQDIAGATIDGVPFYSVVAGFVGQGWDPGGGGNWTTLYAADGARYGYGHAKAFAPGVHNTTVPAGTLLGWIDSTGGSTGPHLHFAYDSNDAGTTYDDPFDILNEAAAAGRYVGETPNLPIFVPPEGFTMEQFDALMGSLNRIETALGTNLNVTGKWMQEQTSLVVDALERGEDIEASRITEAGWASREYLFQLGDEPDVYLLQMEPDGRFSRVHIASPTDDQDDAPRFKNLVVAFGRNPHVVPVTDPDDIRVLSSLPVKSPYTQAA